MQSYWEGTTGKVQSSPQENFKAEQVGVVCDHISHFGSHTSIKGMGGATMLKGPGENTGKPMQATTQNIIIIMIIPSCPIFFKNHLLQVEKNISIIL